MIDNRIHRHRGYSLIDITKTNVTKYTPELERMRNKQRNWETVIQVLGLRSQIMNIVIGKTQTVDLANYNFGQQYVGKHRVWSFEFEVEFDNLYLKDKDPYGVLKNDFSNTPVITNLDETARPPMPIFYTDGEGKNIYFMPVTDK